MTRTTGATDAQIEAAARNKFKESNGYYGNEWNDKLTSLNRHMAIKAMERDVSHIVDTDHRIVRVDDLRALVEFVIACNDEFRVSADLLSAVSRIAAAIGEAE